MDVKFALLMFSHETTISFSSPVQKKMDLHYKYVQQAAGKLSAICCRSLCRRNGRQHSTRSNALSLHVPEHNKVSLWHQKLIRHKTNFVVMIAKNEGICMCKDKQLSPKSTTIFKWICEYCATHMEWKDVILRERVSVVLQPAQPYCHRKFSDHMSQLGVSSSARRKISLELSRHLLQHNLRPFSLTNHDNKRKIIRTAHCIVLQHKTYISQQCQTPHQHP